MTTILKQSLQTPSEVHGVGCSPTPGSADELALFAALQPRLKPLFRDVYRD